ncbi:MAG: hypothetical protein WCO56_27610 [Verrucomicrobiota bacterium]
MAAHQVRALLMGGQACVFYGAAEFSRDTDLAVLADDDNWRRLLAALQALNAEVIAVPACRLDFLQRGHAIHFRCQHPEADQMRVDIMAKMRGVDGFPKLWERRTTLQDADGTLYELLSLADLVAAKKTQRNKDWPMIQRLVESDYLRQREKPTGSQIEFWLRELRTPVLLIEAAQQHPAPGRALLGTRPLLKFAAASDPQALENALAEEEKVEREKDRSYWQPLKAELESLRHSKIQ